ncbi:MULTISPECIES: hypothetical protein [Mycolicibacterium]|uniref:Uncharacterized protein n=2 Tax=Mycolicibacterium TaxID=1866885 RepID=A0A7I7UMM7_MYCPV|nr:MULTISPECIES: hypothetical protein [Mycolicibacterium]MCV6982794.1 hypothetical protein [Mycolicibacterium pulveris]MCV7224346.1 hypothetical protein [Mycolicibacterium elephantis]RWA19877.1 hypothetical protein MELE44368_19775 [Mycolicibacterium elephantis DSM 44368]BBY82655.1 hypothetical protein MPUL_38130 [Mycolicibacterium pulveris]
MRGRTSAPSEDTGSEAWSEAVATTGLILNIAGVIAIAVALASWTVGDGILALVFGVIAAVGFTGSIVCFVRQSADPEVTSPQNA